MTIDLTAGCNFRQNLCGDFELAQNVLVPLQGGEIHQLSAAGISDIGDVTPPSGPPVSFQIKKLSTVPQRRSPASAWPRAPETLLRIQRIFRPLKYVASGSPVLVR